MQVDMAAAGVFAKPKPVRICVHGEMARDEAPGGAAEVIDRIRRGEEPFPPEPVPDIRVLRPMNRGGAGARLPYCARSGWRRSAM